MRRRAKDNKAQIAGEFAKLSELYFEKMRNILFLIAFALFAYTGAVGVRLSLYEITFLTLSMFLGIISYFFSYQHTRVFSDYYSDLEQNLVIAFPTVEEYKEMVNQEKNIREKHKNRNIPQSGAFIATISQALFIISILMIMY